MSPVWQIPLLLLVCCCHSHQSLWKLELHNYDQLSLEVLINLLLHSTSLGSGSHSPFPMHVDEFGPESTSPGGQANMTLAPSTSRAG